MYWVTQLLPNYWSIVTTLVLAVAVYFCTHWRFYYLAFKLPGSPVLPIIGNALSFYGLPEVATKRITKFYAEEMKRNGPKSMFVRAWIGPFLYVFIDDPNTIESVLRSNLKKSQFYSLFDRLSGLGLLTQNNIPKWKSRRKFIGSKSFSFPALKSYIRVFHEESIILADKFMPLALSKKAFEPVDFMVISAFAIGLRTFCGVDFKIQQNWYSENPYTTAAENCLQSFLTRMRQPWLQLTVLYNLLGYKSQELKYCKITREFAMEIISHFRAKANTDENNEMSTKATVSGEAAEVKSFSFVEDIVKDQMDATKSPHDVMDEEELIHHIVLLLNASLTPKAPLTMVLIVLAVNPKLQEEVYNEIESVLGDNKSPPSHEQLNELSVLTRVIMETLRFYPPVPVIGRKIEQDVQVGNYTIPAGASFGVLTHQVHRNPNHWPNPEKFDPDRFLPSEMSKRNPNAYMPFSNGPRNCLGYKFAMLEMKVITSTLLQRYKILPGSGTTCKSMEDIGFAFSLTLRLMPGNDIRLEPRISQAK